MGTIAEKWIEEGREEGREEGEAIVRRTIVQILQSRFGTVSPDLTATLAQYHLEELNDLVNLALEIDSLAGFLTQLPSNTQS
ncbi:MAG: DUF4351 domain-containing protein [Caldilineaceae bacterium]|nr:DUF4351 domain-containing protein [Caldilineaceae bacterium]